MILIYTLFLVFSSTTPLSYHPPSYACIHGIPPQRPTPSFSCLLALPLRICPSIPVNLSEHLNQVIRQQEVRNTFPHDVLVSTVRAYQLPGADLRLHQQDMQVLQQLLIGSEVLWGRGRGWEGRESELGSVSFLSCAATSSKRVEGPRGRGIFMVRKVKHKPQQRQ